MKKRCIILLSLAAIGIFALVYNALKLSPGFENKIVAFVDAQLNAEGEISVDLSMLVTEFEWDTVSVFVGGNPSQIQEYLHVYPDISDGIVFSLNGQPVMVAMSTYEFPADIPPRIWYDIERNDIESPYFVSLPFEKSTVQVKKYLASDGNYHYLLYVNTNITDASDL